jgi:hypothetical protein
MLRAVLGSVPNLVEVVMVFPAAYTGGLTVEEGRPSWMTVPS